MSHTTTIKSVTIRSVSAIKSAVKELQRRGVECTLERDGEPGMYYSNQAEGNCEYVLRLPKARNGGKQYDVGFRKQKDGTYATIFDAWAGAVSGQIGVDTNRNMTSDEQAQAPIGQFLQEYGKYAAMEAATAQGYLVSGATMDADGNYQIEIMVN